MKEDFDFKNIGKRMPYEVPDDFFEEVSDRALAEFERRKVRKAKQVHLKTWISAVAAVVVLAGGVWFAFYQNRGLNSPLAYEQAAKDSSVATTFTVKDKRTGKVPQKQIVFSSKQNKGSQSGKVTQKQTSSSKNEKAETLDDALKSLSKEELEQLNTFSENDFINEE